MGSPLSRHAAELWRVLKEKREKPPNSILGSVLQSEFKRFSSMWSGSEVICARNISVFIQPWWEPIQANAVVVGSFPQKRCTLKIYISISPSTPPLIHVSHSFFIISAALPDCSHILSLRHTLLSTSLFVSALGKLAAFNEFHCQDSTPVLTPIITLRAEPTPVGFEATPRQRCGAVQQ